jgi:gas vesicle protein
MNTYEYQNYESSRNGFIAGMLCGIACGAIAALFLAPRRGAELRGQVANSVNRASRRAMDTYGRASETVNDIASRAADLAETLSTQASTLTAKLNRAMSGSANSSASNTNPTSSDWQTSVGHSSL